MTAPHSRAEGLPPSGEHTSPSRLLTPREVAEMLSVDESWVTAQSRAGKIPAIKLGHYWRYRSASIVQWLEDLEQGASDSPGPGGSSASAGRSRRGTAGGTVR